MRVLTAKDIIGNTPPKVMDAAEGCYDVSLLKDGDDWKAPKKYRKLSQLGTVYRQFYRVQCPESKKYGTPKQVILCWAGPEKPGLKNEETTPGRPGSDTPVWVTCSCEHFRYVCEWALTRYGSSDIIHSNGQSADSTNPRGIGMGCKHIVVALKDAIENWSEEPLEDRQVEEPELEVTPDLPEISPEISPPEKPDPKPLPVKEKKPKKKAPKKTPKTEEPPTKDDQDQTPEPEPAPESQLPDTSPPRKAPPKRPPAGLFEDPRVAPQKKRPPAGLFEEEAPVESPAADEQQMLELLLQDEEAPKRPSRRVTERRETPKGLFTSSSYNGSKLARLAQEIRSIALPFDTDYC
jgi:hypothetical protein